MMPTTTSIQKLSVLLGLLQMASALSPDPGEGKMYLGVWPDLSDGLVGVYIASPALGLSPAAAAGSLAAHGYPLCFLFTRQQTHPQPQMPDSVSTSLFSNWPNHARLQHTIMTQAQEARLNLSRWMPQPLMLHTF